MSASQSSNLSKVMGRWICASNAPKTKGSSGRSLIALCFLLTIGSLLPACDSNQRRHRSQKAVIDQSEQLSRDYLRGDVNGAREALLKDVKLLEDATVLEPIGRAGLLSLSYFRLYVLEKRSGNEVAADANLIKAKYWMLTKEELAGTELAKAMAQINASTADRIIGDISEFDKRRNNGKEPDYLHTIIRNTSSSQGNATNK